MVAVVIIISFLLDGIISTNVDSTSIFLPLFSLLSLLLVYPYFENKNTNFLIVAGIVGVFYDVVYMNSLFLNTLIFILLAFIIVRIFSYLPINIANTIVVSLVTITAYRVIIFLFLFLIQVITFDLVRVANSIACSVISNVLYIIFGYFILATIGKRFKIKKINKI